MSSTTDEQTPSKTESRRDDTFDVQEILVRLNNEFYHRENPPPESDSNTKVPDEQNAAKVEE